MMFNFGQCSTWNVFKMLKVQKKYLWKFPFWECQSQVRHSYRLTFASNDFFNSEY